MKSTEEAWERQIAELWTTIDNCPPEAFVAKLDLLVEHSCPATGSGLFERASARDSTGNPEDAVPLYEAALAAGLTGIRRRRANIQLASSLRNLGNPGKAASLLFTELGAANDELNGAVRAFLALALVDLGREREAVALSLDALSEYLPRYNRSLARYARELSSQA